MKKQRPKIKYFSHNAVRLERMASIGIVKAFVFENAKDGEYNILLENKWHFYIVYNGIWHYNGVCNMEETSAAIKFGLIPNLSNREWDAIKIAGNKRLNKYWQKMLQARLFEEWLRSFKLNQLKRRKLNKMQTTKHYEGKVHPWDIISHLKLGYNLGCVVKYAFRAGKKEGNSVEQDLNKAIAYLEEEMKRPNQYVFTLDSIEYTDNWKWIHSLNLGYELESVLEDIVGYLYCNATPPLNECVNFLKEHTKLPIIPNE